MDQLKRKTYIPSSYKLPDSKLNQEATLRDVASYLQPSMLMILAWLIY